MVEASRRWGVALVALLGLSMLAPAVQADLTLRDRCDAAILAAPGPDASLGLDNAACPPPQPGQPTPPPACVALEEDGGRTSGNVSGSCVLDGAPRVGPQCQPPDPYAPRPCCTVASCCQDQAQCILAACGGDAVCVAGAFEEVAIQTAEAAGGKVLGHGFCVDPTTSPPEVDLAQACDDPQPVLP